MKKLIASALVAAALAVPVGAAGASEADAQFGTEPCRSGQTGIVVWVWDHLENEKDYYRLCIQTGP
ncbi:MAG: hypothetical protein M3323_07425 [Actinomycetota bacterium]|nr:hypothetical protein [Actinomycetota bacterium]